MSQRPSPRALREDLTGRIRAVATRSRGDGLRTCLGCGTAAPPENLLRLIATKDGELLVRSHRAVGGRSAYLCFRRTCIETAFRKKRLSRALRVPGIRTGPEMVIEQASRYLRARIEQLLIRARSAGRLAVGVRGFSCATRQKNVRFLVVASDVSRRSRERLDAASRGPGLSSSAQGERLPLYRLPLSRLELGRLLGGEAQIGGALRDGPLAVSLEDVLLRLVELEI